MRLFSVIRLVVACMAGLVAAMSAARADTVYDFSSVVALGAVAGDGLCVDAQGNVYVSNGSTVLKLGGNGQVATLSVPVSNAVAMTVDAAGTLYLVDQSGGAVLKGTPTQGGGSYDFTSLASGLVVPVGVAVDALGNVYVAEQGAKRVRKISPAGVASVLATLPANSTGPYGITVDSGGNVYVSTVVSGPTGSILKITPDGVSSTFAAVTTSVLAIDRTDTLYGVNGGTLSKVSPGGVVSTATVQYSSGRGLAVDAAGNVYVHYSYGSYVYVGYCRPALNDAFAQAAPISGTFGQFVASNLGATKESGEPNHAGDAGGHSLWWKWTAPTSGHMIAGAWSGNFVPLLGVYVGSSVDALTPVAASAQGVVNIDTVQGFTYYIAVDGPGGAVGTVSLALNPSGLTGWGLNTSGQLGVPSAIGQVTGVSGGSLHTLALKSDGTVAAWGSSSGGATGVPGGLSGVTAVAAGTNYSLALKNDGTVVSWGTGTAAPAASSLSNAVAIAAGSGNGMALKADGTLASWGTFNSASLIGQITGAVGISVRGSDFLAVRSDGTVLGSGSPQGAYPVSGAVAVAVGNNFSLVLKSDGTVVSAGSIVSLSSTLNNNIVAIAAGQSHALALKADGTVVAWGSNSYVPAGLGQVVAISAGDYSSFALQAVAPPVFSAQPASTAVNTGLGATLVSSANASSYQWYQGSSGDTSTPVTGATKPWLVTGALNATASFWVRATNALGSADSRTAIVTVYPKPANDNLAGATVLTGANVQATGTNVGSSWETGENHLFYNFLIGAANTGASVWWSWTAPSDGVVTINTQGSDFLNQLSVYAGANMASLYPVSGNNSPYTASLTNQVTFQARAGATYKIAVSGAVLSQGLGIATGNITLNIALSTSYAPVITGQPAGFAISSGIQGSVSFSYLAYPLPVFQWQRQAAGSATWVNVSDDGTFTGSATATLGMTVSTGMHGDKFRCILDNGLSAPVVSNPAALTVSVPYVFTTMAGTARQSGNIDDVGAAARFTHPFGIALDGTGNLYVADDQAAIIRKIAADGTVTTLAGLAGQTGFVDGQGSAARFKQPAGVAVDAAGNVYVADAGNDAVRKITPDGTVTTLAGSPSTSVFSNPSGVAVDANGTVYVADTYHYTICTVTQAGVVGILAGSSSKVGQVDGIGAVAQFGWPYGVAVDAAGNVYVADYFYDVIRKIAPGAVVTTVAGASATSGGVDGLGVSAGFGEPTALAVDAHGNVYVADSLDNLIRKITPEGMVSTVGGLRNYSGSTDATGTAARFYSPSGIAVDADGVLFIADSYNYTVRKGVPVATAPFITGSPSNLAVGTGQDAAFTAFADGFPAPSYRWQSLPVGASTWTDLTDGGLFSGSATATLKISGGPVDLTGEQFRCVATNGAGADATGLAATLTVTPPAFSDWTGGLGLSGAAAATDAAPFAGGLPNLARYAMNLGAAPTADQLPSLGSEVIGGAPYVALRFRARKGMTAVQLGAESSTDLNTWTPVSGDAISPLSDDDLNTARFEARVPVPAGGKVFLRLRATQSP